MALMLSLYYYKFKCSGCSCGRLSGMSTRMQCCSCMLHAQYTRMQCCSCMHSTRLD